MKHRHLFLFVCSVIALLSIGCASWNEKKQQLNRPTPEDMAEADYIRQILSEDPDMKGTYAIVPGQEVTTVHITWPDAPGDEAEFRQSLREIREEMKLYFVREPNRLRFIFKTVTIEE